MLRIDISKIILFGFLTVLLIVGFATYSVLVTIDILEDYIEVEKTERFIIPEHLR